MARGWSTRKRESTDGAPGFAIPLRTLRFATGENQVWGINFERRIRHRNETAYWAPLPRQYTLARVSLTGTLEGLDHPKRRAICKLSRTHSDKATARLNPRYRKAPPASSKSGYRTTCACVPLLIPPHARGELVRTLPGYGGLITLRIGHGFRFPVA